MSTQLRVGHYCFNGEMCRRVDAIPKEFHLEGTYVYICITQQWYVWTGVPAVDVPWKGVAAVDVPAEYRAKLLLVV
ncbi:MAG: hypothetical protein KC496_00575 [Anaerolineae bacterium]|nr:hypothetical protein [Anaerolineae bacterium]